MSKLIFTERAWEEYLYWQTQDKKTLKRKDNINFNTNVEDNKLILKKKQEKTKFELLAEKSAGEKSNPKIDIDFGELYGKEEW
ncbi:hypothetical protein [Sedimentibacter sp.]|uniref:hypothetical protein n=1 Tax=Sedimentibacter sp. TaxID=1960295 RepID=UPI0028AC4EC2|nr:hypothetical protein [Sedimentibacter sp.]